MTHPGKEPGMTGYPTPNEIPDNEDGYLVFRFPNNEEIPQLILGALKTLSFSYNYYMWGDCTPEETSLILEAIIRQAPYNLIPSEVPAPYWEDGEETDDEMSIEDQIWYGEYDGDSFIENAALWVVTNFLAKAVSPTAAILYKTHQKKVRLSFLKGGLGGVVKVYVEDALAQIVDLNGEDGEVLDVDVITGYVDTAIDLLQVLESIP